MRSIVKLSELSQHLIKKYSIVYPCSFNGLVHDNETIDAVELINWLACNKHPVSMISKKESEFILASLRAELLKDLLVSMKGSETHIKNAKKNSSLKNKFKFFGLAILGTLFAACEGFDGIASLMSIFAVPPLVILSVGLVFSVLSILVFYGFDLVMISQNLNVNLRDTPKLLDVYLLQMKEIKAIRQRMSTYDLAACSALELEYYDKLSSMLHQSLVEVTQSSKKFKQALNSRALRIAEKVIAVGTGILFFGGGFFAGQSVAMFVLGFFMATVTPVIWPVILFGTLIGLAAFCLYWNVERVGVKNMLSRWFGLSEEKVDQLCKPEHLVKEKEKLTNLQQQIKSTISLRSHLSDLEKINDSEERISNDMPLSVVRTHDKLEAKLSANMRLFHPKPSNQANISLEDDSSFNAEISKQDYLLNI